MPRWMWTLNRLVVMRGVAQSAPEPAWASGLSRELGTYMQTTSRVLIDLANEGYIEVAADDGTRRTLYVLTPEGREVMPAVHRDLARMEGSPDAGAVERVAKALAELDGSVWRRADLGDSVQHANVTFYLTRARVAVDAMRQGQFKRGDNRR